MAGKCGEILLLKVQELSTSTAKTWFLELRPAFLILSVILVSIGTSVAWYEGAFHLWHFLIALLGMLLVHVACNILNDYFDFESGLDLQTEKTPFSGGSGILPEGRLNPKSVIGGR